LPAASAVLLSRTLGGQIAATLRRDIITGQFDAGAMLREIPLAKRFGVSRGPIRDALRELAEEGMVEPLHRGMRVAAAAPDAIHEFVSPLRRTIECYALRLVFNRLDEGCFSTWERILATMRRACVAADEILVVEQDIAFHRSILELARQPDLLAIWSTIVARIRRHFIEGSRRYADPLDQYAEHVRLFEAFATRNIDNAVQALEAHIG
jgi:GntR family transcriptional regulator, rspAB operon transcriptional repressor